MFSILGVGVGVLGREGWGKGGDYRGQCKTETGMTASVLQHDPYR